MLRKQNLLRHARAAVMAGVCAVALSLGATEGAAQVCDLQLEPTMGGIAEAQTDIGFVYDAELAIEIAPDLSYVQLENSEIRVRFSPFSSASPQFAITPSPGYSCGQSRPRPESGSDTKHRVRG